MADTNARAALMRLLHTATEQRRARVGETYATWCQIESEISREIAALPADEMVPPFEGDPKDCAFKPADEACDAATFFEDARKKWPPMGTGKRAGEPDRSGIAWLSWFCGKLWEVGVAPPGDARLAAEIAGHLASPADEAAVCEFCDGPLGDKSDHGLGECCPICPTCDGTGSADEAAGASAGLVEEVAEMVARWDAQILGHDGLTFTDSQMERRIRNAIEAERARKPQPDERDKTIAELLQMHNDTERVLDECGLLHDVKAALPDKVRAVCKEVVELREKVADLHKQIDGMAEDYQTCAKAYAAEEHRAEKAEAEAEELREKLRQAHAVEEIAQGVLPLAVERYKKAEAEAARYRETLVSKHGGEPLSLLDELDEARAQLAEARKAGLRELREWFVGERTIPLHHPNPTHYGPPMTINGDEKRIILLAIDRLLAADSEHKEPDSEHNAEDSEHKDDDATLREFVQWFESPGRHDIQPPVRAAYVLAKRALGVTGGGRKE